MNLGINESEGLSPGAMRAALLDYDRLILDQPEDRLWHAADGTWWRRLPGPYHTLGRLVAADPPEAIRRLADLVREAALLLPGLIDDSYVAIDLAAAEEQEERCGRLRRVEDLRDRLFRAVGFGPPNGDATSAGKEHA